MGVGAYNRGSRVVTRDADAVMPQANARAARDAERDQLSALRAENARLQRDLQRARRCIAELRRAKEARMAEARAELSASQFAIRILTKIAFPHEV